MNLIITIIMTYFAYTSSSESDTLSQFDNQNDLKWQTVNDGVMGGLSQGIFQYSDNGTGIFKGNISLENNGGFSWLRATDPNLNLKESSGISIRLKGDGRKYALTLKNPAKRRVMYFASFFETKKDEWMELKIPLDSFKGYFYGQNINAISSMNYDKLKEVGIILLDKKQGPFILEIDWIGKY